METALPQILKGKLEFGNRDQIDAMQNYERELDAADNVETARAEGNLKTYKCKVYFSGTTEIEIEAADIADVDGQLDRMDLEPDDFNINDVDIDEIKGDRS